MQADKLRFTAAAAAAAAAATAAVNTNYNNTDYLISNQCVPPPC
jgi:hypothetical protein